MSQTNQFYDLTNFKRKLPSLIIDLIEKTWLYITFKRFSKQMIHLDIACITETSHHLAPDFIPFLLLSRNSEGQIVPIVIKKMRMPPPKKRSSSSEFNIVRFSIKWLHFLRHSFLIEVTINLKKK